LIFINTLAINKRYRWHMSNVQHPACPGCAKPMTAFRAKLAGHPSRRSFQCRECGTIYSEKPSAAVVAADRALTLNFEVESCRPQ
jgi:tRNA(Ile2) C34 agmatinyltransferase TiaS